jgi:hypothetical protein
VQVRGCPYREALVCQPNVPTKIHLAVASRHRRSERSLENTSGDVSRGSEKESSRPGRVTASGRTERVRIVSVPPIFSARSRGETTCVLTFPGVRDLLRGALLSGQKLLDTLRLAGHLCDERVESYHESII